MPQPFSAGRLSEATLFESPHLLVGLNAFEPGQTHALHAHHGMLDPQLSATVRIQIDLIESIDHVEELPLELIWFVHGAIDVAEWLEVSTDARRPSPPGRAPTASACEPYRELIAEALGRGRKP